MLMKLMIDYVHQNLQHNIRIILTPNEQHITNDNINDIIDEF